MWMEAKAVITGISLIMLAISVLLAIIGNIVLSVLLLIMGMAFQIFGEIIIGMKIVDYKPLFESTPHGWELMELELLNGRVVYINTHKGAYGKRSFRMHQEDASVIYDGKANFTLPNGNRGFRALEGFDRNIDPHRAKALEQMDGGDIKEIYYAAIEEIKKKEDETDGK